MLRPASSTWRCIAMTWERALNCRSCANRNFHCHWRNAPSSLSMTFFTPAAPCARAMDAINSFGRPARIQLAVANRPRPSRAADSPRLRRKEFADLEANEKVQVQLREKPMRNRTAFGWKENDDHMTTLDTKRSC